MERAEELRALTEHAQARSAGVRLRHQSILPPTGEPWHPIPFFGPIKQARVLTVAMNPSADEFRGRGWPSALTASALTDRLVSYFQRDPHPWFGPSETPLRGLGLRYGRDLAHLDLVCRATRTIKTADRDAFLALADEEADLFFGALNAAASARIVILCGSVTNARYAHEHVARHAAAQGWRFAPKPHRQPGGPFAARHELRHGTRALAVLFVSASVNRRDGPGHYQGLVTAHRDWLAEQLGE